MGEVGRLVYGELPKTIEANRGRAKRNRPVPGSSTAAGIQDVSASEVNVLGFGLRNIAPALRLVR